MQLSELITIDDVLVPFEANDKWDAIRRLVDHLVDTGRVAAQEGEAIHEAVVARERSMSTGMEHGIAIPHAAVDGIEDVIACLGILPADEGLVFESVDGRRTQLIVLLVIPRSKKLLHIRTLADIARVLSREAVREALIQSTDGEAAWRILSEGEAAAQA
jgi:mannitol/fructose-specific phosphotransferase system IIA component (Ntr-type)